MLPWIFQFKVGSTKIRTWGCWVRSANATSVLCSPPIFERWICRFGVPLEIITDQRNEFCAKLTKDLFQLLQITISTSTAYHPQCNSQAETIAKYLTSYVSDSTLDWEDYLAPMMFSYNTSFHQSIPNTPFFLTRGMEARQPTFDTARNRIQMEGPKPSQEILDRLYEARQRVTNANQDATATALEYYDQGAEPHLYHRDQLVLLQEPDYLNRNAKFAPKWTGPHQIEQLKGDQVGSYAGAVSFTHVAINADFSSIQVARSQARLALQNYDLTLFRQMDNKLRDLQTPLRHYYIKQNQTYHRLTENRLKRLDQFDDHLDNALRVLPELCT